MTLTARRFPEAEEDIFETARHFDEYDESIVDRFFEAVDRTVGMLCENPDIGEIFRHDPAGETRHRTIIGFQNYVIFYRHTETD